MSKQLAEDVRSRVIALGFERHKLIVQVHRLNQSGTHSCEEGNWHTDMVSASMRSFNNNQMQGSQAESFTS